MGSETAADAPPIVHSADTPIDFQSPDGWIAIARAMRSHCFVGFGMPVPPVDPLKGSYSRAEAWIDLIMECRYEAGTVNNNGKKMRLEQGQVLGAVAWLAHRWNWTPKTVRGFLDRLEMEGMISRFSPGSKGDEVGSKQGNRKGKFASVITVCKYATYQISEDRRRQVERQVEGALRASYGQVEGNIYKDNKGTKEQGNNNGEEPSSLGPAGSGNGDALEAFHLYNDLALRCGLPKAKSLTPQRRKALMARLREHGGMEAWRAALVNVERSAFLRGNNDRGWRADLDFLLQASRFAKVIDGAYGNGAHAPIDPAKTVDALDGVYAEMRAEEGWVDA